MKKIRKMLALLLILALVLTTLPGMAAASKQRTELRVDEAEALPSYDSYYETRGAKRAPMTGAWGSDIQWELGGSGTLKLTGTGVLASEDRPDGWFEGMRDEILQVELSEGITGIGDGVFSYCAKLKQISIPDSCTVVGERAFIGCSVLESVSFSPKTTSIGVGAFQWCYSLQEITIPDGVTVLNEWLFEGCKALKRIELGSGVKTIKAASMGHTALEEIEIPSQVEEINSWAWRGTTTLRQIKVSSSNLRFMDMDGVLYTRNADTLIIYPPAKGGTCQVLAATKTIEEGAFSYSNVENVIFSNSVSNIGYYAFAYCKQLRQIAIPPAVKEIQRETFYGDNNLETVVLPYGVEYILRDCFRYCPALHDINLPTSLKTIEECAFAYCKSLESVKLPWTDCKIGIAAFAGTGMEEILIPPQITQIGRHAFGYSDTNGAYPEYPDDSSIVDNFVVKCVKGTAGEAYADENDFMKQTIMIAKLRGFLDVNDPDEYYYDPVYWAVNEGITKGTDELFFSPDETCTRAQIVTFLWRTAGCPEAVGRRNPFLDVSADEYYYDAVLWAVEQRITNGTDDFHFSPDDTCTRAQVVTFLWRYFGMPAGRPTTFVDVERDSFYSDAVNWAVLYGITRGTDDTHFSPEEPCTRAQVVTFLYRSFHQS